MKSRVALTAFRVMFYIALEQYLPEKHRLVDDPLAASMLPWNLKLLVKLFGSGSIRQPFFNLIDRNFPGVRAGSCRKRFIDEKLIAALTGSFESVVILGSGLDTRPYRLPQLSTVKVYEVDLPQTIAYKADRLTALYGSVPSHVRLVPIDFNQQALGDVLSQHGCLQAQKSFFIWEGVTQYLSEPAVRKVFEYLAGVSPGSQIVFTYILKDFIDGKNVFGLEQLYKQTRGDPPMWLFGFQPSRIQAFLDEYGWKEIEQAGAAEYRQRYLLPAGRTDEVMEIERAVYAVKA